MPVDLERVPAERLGARDVPVEIPADHRLAALAEAVHVDDRGEVVELEVRGVLERLPHRPFGHLAVAAEHPHAVSDAVEVLARDCHADTDGKALAEGAGGDVDPRDARRGMALEHARVLAVVEDVVVGDDPCGAVDRVQQGRCMALGEDQAVVRRALRVGEVEAEVALDEDRHEIGGRHRRGGMARARGGAHTNGVDAELLRELPARVGRGHRAILGRSRRGYG